MIASRSAGRKSINSWLPGPCGNRSSAVYRACYDQGDIEHGSRFAVAHHAAAVLIMSRTPHTRYHAVRHSRSRRNGDAGA